MDKKVKDIGTLPGDNLSNAVDINNKDEVVGVSGTKNGAGHVFRYSIKNKNMLDLGTLGGKDSYAWVINDSSQVVGHSETKTGKWHAFLWEAGKMKDLGTLGVGESEALGINAKGQIVGNSGEESKKHAFLWERGKMQDLNDLLPPHSDWILEAATAINDRGQIVGYGIINSQEQIVCLIFCKSSRFEIEQTGFYRKSEAISRNTRTC